MVHVYHGTNGTMILRVHRVPWYATSFPVASFLRQLVNIISKTTDQWYQWYQYDLLVLDGTSGTYMYTVPWYHGTRVRTRVRTRVTLSQKRTYTCTVEPRVLQPQDGADQRRGDIKVSKHGNTWILDVGVVCPGTQRYVDQGRPTCLSSMLTTPTCLRGLWWRSALQTSLSSWDLNVVYRDVFYADNAH